MSDLHAEAQIEALYLKMCKQAGRVLSLCFCKVCIIRMVPKDSHYIPVLISDCKLWHHSRLALGAAVKSPADSHAFAGTKGGMLLPDCGGLASAMRGEDCMLG